jgi:phage tail sheath gpL-like
MGGADIVLTGLAANDAVPNPAYVQVDFAQGEAAGSSDAYEILLIGNRTSAGSATVDTEVYGPDSLTPMQTEADVITLFGTGSEIHRMWRRVTKINKDTVVRALAVTESAGTQASATCVISNAATANGAVRIWVGDEFVDASVTSGDAVDTIGAAMAAAVNTMTHWPVTASYDSGTDTLTITARLKGPRGNEIRYQILAVSGLTGTTFSTGSTPTALSSGATADSNTSALATILPDRYYYIVSAANDSTQLGALVTQVNTQAVATTGIRQRVFAGYTGSLANGITLATGINAARCEIVWQKTSDWTGAELAANQAALAALYEVKPNPRCNFCNFGNNSSDATFWIVPAPRKTSDHPTRADIKSALNNGLSPIGVNRKSRSTYLVNRITSRSLNGSQNDYRIRPAHKVTICDFFADDLIAVITSRFADKKMGDDVPQGTPPLGSDFVTPDRMKGAISGLINTYDANGLWQPGGAARMKANLEVRRSTNPKTRMGVRIQAEPVDAFEQGAIQIMQIA